MHIARSRPATRQPHGAPNVFSGNPLAAGLSFWRAGPREAIETVTGAKQIATRDFGLALGFGSTYGTSTSDVVVTRFNANAPQRTYFAIFNALSLGGGSFGRIFAKQATGTAGSNWSLDTSGGSVPRLSFFQNFSGGQAQWQTNATPISFGSTYSAALCYDNTSSANAPTFYVNGSLESSLVVTAPSGTVVSNSDFFCIGNRQSDLARVFDGWIGPFLVWDKILSSTEIAAVHDLLWRVFRTRSIVMFPSASGGGGLSVEVSPTTGHLVLTGYAPTITQTANREIRPGTGHLTLTGYAPTIQQSANREIRPGTGHLVLTGYAPILTQTANREVRPGVGHLVLTGYAPTIVQTANREIRPGKGALTLTGHAPVITQTGGQVIMPATGHLVLSGHAPTITQTANRAVAPSTGHLVLTGHMPTIIATANREVRPGAGHLVLTGHAPVILLGSASERVPARRVTVDLAARRVKVDLQGGVMRVDLRARRVRANLDDDGRWSREVLSTGLVSTGQQLTAAVR